MRQWKLATFLIAAAALIGVASVSAQSNADTRPPDISSRTFEAAVIRPSNPKSTGIPSGTCQGTDNKLVGTNPLGRCVFSRLNLKQLLVAAYYPSLRNLVPLDELIAGGPAWASEDLFDIEAKAEDPLKTTNEDLLSMLRALLADRFKLQTHHETKLFSGYALLQSKGRAKLAPQPEGCTSGGIRIGGSAAVKSVTGRCIQMEGLSKFLTYQLQAPVRDLTDLPGSYDFLLEYTPGLGMPGAPTSEDPPSAASIFTAIQEQMGLRLESQKVPMDIIVIETASRPGAHRE